MSKLLTISHYEFRVQIKRVSTWGVFITAMIFALIDNYPTTSNLIRLEFLKEPSYFIYRIMNFDVLILFFGLMFILSNRISTDLRTGVKSLMMAGTTSKCQYILGKIFGNFLYVYLILTIFLMLNTGIYYVASPGSDNLIYYIIPMIKALVVCGIPISFFITAISICLPAILDIRLFYLFAAILFFLNAASVPSAEKMPFYLITSGDLMKLIWQHPKWPFINRGSIQMNLVFLFGSAILSYVWLLLKKGFWRTDD